MNLPTREQLTKRRGIVIADAQMKFEIADWHGVADACMDLREIDAQIALFDQLREASRGNGGWSENALNLEGAILPNGDIVGPRVI